jgi:hypothetical protein
MDKGSNPTPGVQLVEYPDTCIPSPPPNLNCGDISDKRFEVLSPDPHGFDRDAEMV